MGASGEKVVWLMGVFCWLFVKTLKKIKLDWVVLVY